MAVIPSARVGNLILGRYVYLQGVQTAQIDVRIYCDTFCWFFTVYS